MESQGRAAEASDFLEGVLADLGPEADDDRARAEARLGLLRVQSLALLAAGDLDRGIEAIERPLEMDESSWGGWLELTRARARAGRPGVAAAGERAWALRPTPDVAAAVADALERAGRIVEAGGWRARAAESAAPAEPVGGRPQASASTRS